MPGKKITINMAPAVRKEGSYDLTIGILVASEQIKAIDIVSIIMGGCPRWQLTLYEERYLSP
jgi:predicted ATPase with chaperone activity